ncbi:MAG: DNA recombination protein RmuC [Candidatus Anammoxibacter sp.]
MVEILLISIVALLVAVIILQVIATLRGCKEKFPQLENHLVALESGQERTGAGIKDELKKNREEFSFNARQGREEVAGSFKLFSDFIRNQLETFANQLSKLTQTNEQRLDAIRKTVEEKIKEVQDSNEKNLGLIRTTVDEKLSETLEKRLGESFKSVSDRLKQVHEGLGEMRALATGVGDLKNVLTNIKTRGTWGEIQLGALLEQVLTHEQYEKNVTVKEGSNERVDFAIKLPGRDKDDNNKVWLPIDSKFPKEDYDRLIDAQEQGNVQLADEAAKQLEIRIKSEAKEIKGKYINPPNTTDFGIMFLPFESLYAEVLRRPGLCDLLQRDYRVIITGPSTIAALINSLQMGFMTLAIEKRSSEVWALLSVVKTEFGNFGVILDKTQKKLQEASNTIESAARKSRTIERKLRDIQDLPSSQSTDLLDGVE